MTLKDVALKANCSVATVSKALKNSSEISGEAKERILEAAKECGYFKKATTRTAVLGALKTVIFNDINGDSAGMYAELQKLAKRQGLTLIYVAIKEKESLELLEQIGAFGLILKNGSEKHTSEKVFVLKEDILEITEFLKSISEYMPLRPSRASASGKNKILQKESLYNKENEKTNTEEKQPVIQEKSEKKEEIWLL